MNDKVKAHMALVAQYGDACSDDPRYYNNGLMAHEVRALIEASALALQAEQAEPGFVMVPMSESEIDKLYEATLKHPESPKMSCKNWLQVGVHIAEARAMLTAARPSEPPKAPEPVASNRPLREYLEERIATMTPEQLARYETARDRIKAAIITPHTAPVNTELLLGWTRYEKLRRLRPVEFAELHRRNIAGEFFDDLVDSLPAVSTPRPAAAHTAPVPLSDAEIDAISFANCGSLSFAANQRAFARAIERAVLGRGGALAGDTGGEVA